MENGDKRKLTMPSWHVPYLEKHRIYELFHELARELVIQQPVDHVLFLKQILSYAMKSRDTARIILLGSPRVNTLEVGQQTANFTEHYVITESMVLARLNASNRSETNVESIVMCLHAFASCEKAKQGGWIMIDCIKNSIEAKRLLQIGILPTHVLHLIPPFAPDLTKLLYCNVLEGWPEYRRHIIGIREVFKTKLLEVPLLHKSLSDVVEQVSQIIKIQQYTGGPIIPRVVILGPRGSGRRIQAELLVKNLNLIHIRFEYLLCQVWVSNTELGLKLRNCGERASYHSELLGQVLNQRILEQDCLENGWVLTGFPFTVMDFRYVDCLDTPPNRVVFLEADLNTCRERLINRRTDINTGSTINVTSAEQEKILKATKHLGLHPKDRISIVEAELTFYCEQYGDLRKYCGGTAIVVSGDQPERHIQENILAFIARNSPTCPPRTPYVTPASQVTEELVGEQTEEDADKCSTTVSQVMSVYVSQVF